MEVFRAVVTFACVAVLVVMITRGLWMSFEDVRRDKRNREDERIRKIAAAIVAEELRQVRAAQRETALDVYGITRRQAIDDGTPAQWKRRY